MTTPGRRYRHLFRSNSLLGAGCVALAAGLVMGGGARPVGAAEVEGRIINVSRQGAPLSGAEVQLVGLSGTGPPAQALSGADGAFRFARAAAGSTAVYRLEATFAGQRQSSEPFAVNTTRLTHNLAVYDTTSSAQEISVEKVHVILNPDAKGVGVTSIYIVQNWGGIFLGDPPTASENRRIGVRFLLPPDAAEFQVMQGVLGAHHVVMPWGFASTIPFYPGSDTLVFSYRIPWQGDRASFNLESPYRIASLSVIAISGAADIRVEGGEDRPSPMGGGMGQQLTNIGRSNIPPNTSVRVDVLPPSKGAAARQLSAGDWLVVVAAVAVIGVIVFAIYVRRKQAAPGEQASEAGGQPEEEAVVAESGEARSRLVDDLVRQIADLDEAYEKGQIGEADYVSRRRALKAQLIRAVKAE